MDDNRILNKALAGLLTGQQTLSQAFSRTNKGLERTNESLGKTCQAVAETQKALADTREALADTQEALAETIVRVDGVVESSRAQEERLKNVIEVLGSMAERNVGSEKWRRTAEERMDSLEERMRKLEDAG